MNLGIVSYGLYLPNGFEDADEIAQRAGLKTEAVRVLGIERKFLPSPNDQPIPMAVKAAKHAFEKASGVAPQDIDVVLWIGEEYKDYIARLQGNGNPAYYWHNDVWLDMWQKWIHYQHAIDTYLKSKEFTRLLQELKQGGSI